MAYIRFVRPARVAGLRSREGFFCAAYELRDAPDLDPHGRDRLEELLAWFRANLPIPEAFARSRKRDDDDRVTRGLSWFRDDAEAVVGKSFELVSLLDEYGYPVDILRSNRIGFVVYEDALQVVAEPFSDTPV